jgi:carbon-monoxide dehydrogenase medium subunit
LERRDGAFGRLLVARGAQTVFVKPFRYERVSTLTEASEVLRSYGGEARPIAGGQSLLPLMNLGLVEVPAVVDISRVEGASGVAEDDGMLRIGALTTQATLERDQTVRRRQPLISAAAASVGNHRVRARGTLGGSLAHSDPAAELPLVMAILGADYEVTDARSVRVISAAELPIGYFTTQLGDDELLAWARVPALGPGWGWGFMEVSRRPGDFAVVAAAALARCADDLIVETRVGLAAVADRPIRVPAVEAAVDGARVDELEHRVGPIEGIDPVTDTVASSAYRKRIARILVLRALEDACRRSREAA